MENLFEFPILGTTAEQLMGKLEVKFAPLSRRILAFNNKKEQKKICQELMIKENSGLIKRYCLMTIMRNPHSYQLLLNNNAISYIELEDSIESQGKDKMKIEHVHNCQGDFWFLHNNNGTKEYKSYKAAKSAWKKQNLGELIVQTYLNDFLIRFCEDCRDNKTFERGAGCCVICPTCRHNDSWDSAPAPIFIGEKECDKVVSKLKLK